MTVLLVLLAVGAVSWLYRISFTAVLSGDRLPAPVRDRMDAVGPAAFAALLATHLTGTSTAELPPLLVALAAAGIAAHATRNHLLAVLAAGGAWWAVTAL